MSLPDVVLLRTNCNIFFSLLIEIYTWGTAVLQSDGVYAEVGKFSTCNLVLRVRIPERITSLIYAFQEEQRLSVHNFRYVPIIHYYYPLF